VEGISSGHFPMQESNMCVSCSVWANCEYGTALMELKAKEAEEAT